jgi:hypothetical protein
MDEKHWLKTTNEFGILGLKLLYFSNAGAIIALLANINNFVDEEDFPTISSSMSLFIWGLLFALLSSFLGYLMYRLVVHSVQSSRTSKWEHILGGLALLSAMASFFSFAFGAHQAISVVEYAL